MIKVFAISFKYYSFTEKKDCTNVIYRKSQESE